MISRRHVLTGAAAGLLLAGCSTSPTPPAPPGDEQPRVEPDRHAVVARTPASDLVVPVTAGGAVAVSRALLAAATAVVVVGSAPEASASPPPSDATPSPAPSDAAPSASATPAEEPIPDLAAAAAVARALGLPLFEAGDGLRDELDRLQTRTVVAYGAGLDVGDRELVAGPATADALRLPGLPARAEAPGALVLAVAAPSEAVAATVAAAGLEVVTVGHRHPGATAAAVEAVRAHQGPVVGLGEGFGDAASFTAALAATRTAPLLPGGSVTPLPDHHMVALYGHPETAALGMLGEQPPAGAVARVQAMVAEYQRHLPDQHVMGAFEIIATVASGSAGADGDYSYETAIAKLLPWVEAAEAAGLYVVLDLQPGRTDFLTQAQRYEELLRRPHVGLALDPEWRLGPNERHLVKIGQVGVDEVSRVGAWLADLVRNHQLPPKVLTLHQFQVRMIVDRERLDTSRPEVQWLVHVDGQGTQPMKQATWGVLKKNLPEGVFLGWKNFEHEDKPMLTPAQTVEQVHPTPHFISYQ